MEEGGKGVECKVGRLIVCFSRGLGKECFNLCKLYTSAQSVQFEILNSMILLYLKSQVTENHYKI